MLRFGCVVAVVCLLTACGGRKEALDESAPTATAEVTPVAPVEVVEEPAAPVAMTAESANEQATALGLTGVVSETYADGSKAREASYNDAGRKDGAYKTHHANGEVYEQGSYVDGKRHGQWKFYYPSGQLMEQSAYDHGRPVGLHQAYLEDGTKIVERDYRRGLN